MKKTDAVAEPFETFWPIPARLVHIINRSNPKDGDKRWTALCRGWQLEDEGELLSVFEGEEYLLCATCTKRMKKRIKKGGREE